MRQHSFNLIYSLTFRESEFQINKCCDNHSYLSFHGKNFQKIVGFRHWNTTWKGAFIQRCIPQTVTSTSLDNRSPALSLAGRDGSLFHLVTFLGWGNNEISGKSFLWAKANLWHCECGPSLPPLYPTQPTVKTVWKAEMLTSKASPSLRVKSKLGSTSPHTEKCRNHFHPTEGWLLGCQWSRKSSGNHADKTR